jgi:very-short-patch-repair endonuclease
LGTLARLALSRREVPTASPFDRFTVDFYCHAAKLAVELDGKQHEWFSDFGAGRTEVLERLGLHILRFTNSEVADDLDSYWRGFARSCGCRSIDVCIPSPLPSPDGRGVKKGTLR